MLYRLGELLTVPHPCNGKAISAPPAGLVKRIQRDRLFWSNLNDRLSEAEGGRVKINIPRQALEQEAGVTVTSIAVLTPVLTAPSCVPSASQRTLRESGDNERNEGRAATRGHARGWRRSGLHRAAATLPAHRSLVAPPGKPPGELRLLSLRLRPCLPAGTAAPTRACGRHRPLQALLTTAPAPDSLPESRQTVVPP